MGKRDIEFNVKKNSPNVKETEFITQMGTTVWHLVPECHEGVSPTANEIISWHPHFVRREGENEQRRRML
jgi:hypothetical protein